MNNTRPFSARRCRRICQNCSNRLVGTWESQAEEENHVEPIVRRPREHVGDFERDVARPHPITGDGQRLGRRIGRHDRVGHADERLGPQAGSLQAISKTRPRGCIWATSRPMRSRAAATSPYAVTSKLARTATVVTNLIGQNLVHHISIITRRRPSQQALKTRVLPAPGVAACHLSVPPGLTGGHENDHGRGRGDGVHCHRFFAGRPGGRPRGRPWPQWRRPPTSTRSKGPSDRYLQAWNTRCGNAATATGWTTPRGDWLLQTPQCWGQDTLLAARPDGHLTAPR